MNQAIKESAIAPESLVSVSLNSEEVCETRFEQRSIPVSPLSPTDLLESYIIDPHPKWAFPLV